MRIDEYKRVLKELGEDDLDKIVVRRSGDSLMLECPINPPPGWEKLQGALSRPPSPTQRVPHGNPATQTPGQEPLPTNAFLTGLMADLTAAFGEAIAVDCLRSDLLRGTQLTARQVMTIIGQAEAKEARVRQQNDGAISTYFRDVEWANFAKSNLSVEAASFVRKLAAALIQNTPEYGRESLSRSHFHDAEARALSVYFAIEAMLTKYVRAPEAALSLILDRMRKTDAQVVLQSWPGYVIAAYLYEKLDPTARNSHEKQLLSKLCNASPVSADSSKAIASRFIALFIHQIEEAQRPEVPPGDDDAVDLAVREAYTFAVELLGTIADEHAQQLTLIAQDAGISDWTKDFLMTQIDGVPIDWPRFGAIVSLSSLDLSSVSTRLFDLLGMICDTAIQFAELSEIESPFHGEQLLPTLLTVGFGRLTPAEVRVVLDALDSGSGQAMPNDVSVADQRMLKEAYEIVTCQFRSRTGEAGPDFQLYFKAKLASERSSYYDIMENRPFHVSFIDDLCDAVITIKDPGGRAIIDKALLKRLDSDRQYDYVMTSLLDTLAPLLDRHGLARPIELTKHELIERFVCSLNDLDKAFADTCMQTLFGQSDKGPAEVLSLSDGTPIVKVDNSWKNTATVTLISVAEDSVRLSYHYCISQLKSAFDATGKSIALDSKRSQIRISADITISRDMFARKLATPVLCDATLVPSQWPADKSYREPTGIDLQRWKDEHHAARRKDLIAFATATGMQEIVTTALDTFEAIEAFQENPSREAAFAIYALIQNDAFAFLSDRKPLARVLDTIYPMLETFPVVDALNLFTDALAHLDSASMAHGKAISAILELADRIRSTDEHQDFRDFVALRNLLSVSDKALSEVLNSDQKKLLGRLRLALRELLVEPDPILFFQLEKAISDYLEENVLRDFIEHEIAQSMREGANQ
ncbi:hypothetical protein [Propionivibrio dicarboxylicus]|uniref:Uncharacterized protein n=1 Tax=Propionivibrio dicarboxylicus TaxID=83767 RepID=A0A1G8KMI7_9RHOO|nr:hypothetical protein [Propionivibrio dicarboxylicus]SDI44586.1 hypothetical protein SAMN05660652_03440 [Propionivibrio dicarboxylicus]